MDLIQNPFHALAASPRDDRRRILELADERSLLVDSEECARARSELTNPRKRLSAEVAWLPGVGPKRADELLSLVDDSPSDLLDVDNLTSIARANLLAAGLSRLSECSPDDVAEWILEIARAFEGIKLESLKGIINEERVVSGFPEVTDESVLESEIQERRQHYRQIIKRALDRLKSMELVKAVTIAVESATEHGEKHGPILIDDLVDAYEVEAKDFLEKEAKNVEALIEKIRMAVDAEHADSMVARMVERLMQVVLNWDAIAQPIQVSAMSRGLSHAPSLRIAGLVRSVAIHIFNDHDKLELSESLMNMLKDVFAEVGEVVERTEEDSITLGEIKEHRQQALEGAEVRSDEWNRAITYEASVGLIFKSTLRISPNGVEWKRRRWKLDSITRVRWGGTRHSTNGMHTGTTYSIFLGTKAGHELIELKDANIYREFIEHLWKAVGVRLTTEFLEGLRDGKRYRFGSAIVSDEGIELERKRVFVRNERVFCKWDELIIWDGAGTFNVGKQEDKSLTGTFTYQVDDNIHILEAAMRMLWKHGGKRISSVLTH